jgi:hypothetical protein
MARKGEYPVPTNARIARCKSCGAEIYWTTTENRRSTPLSASTVRTSASDEDGGMRYALVHWADCPHAEEHRAPGGVSYHDGKMFPLTMAFPPGAFVPVFCAHVTTWPDRWMTVTFDRRGQLEEDVFVSLLARELGLTGRVVEPPVSPRGERGDVPRVEME